MSVYRSDCQWPKLDMPGVASDAVGHSMSPFGHLDAELGVPSSGCLSDDDSHLLSHDTPGGGQLVQSRTTLVTSKSLPLSPIHVMMNSIVNSVTGVSGIIVSWGTQTTTLPSLSPRE